jgi:hypothetical protein
VGWGRWGLGGRAAAVGVRAVLNPVVQLLNPVVQFLDSVVGVIKVLFLSLPAALCISAPRPHGPPLSLISLLCHHHLHPPVPDFGLRITAGVTAVDALLSQSLAVSAAVAAAAAAATAVACRVPAKNGVRVLPHLDYRGPDEVSTAVQVPDLSVPRSGALVSVSSRRRIKLAPSG